MKPQHRTAAKSFVTRQEYNKSSNINNRSDDSSGLFHDISSGKLRLNSLVTIFMAIVCVISVGFLTSFVYLPKVRNILS